MLVRVCEAVTHLLFDKLRLWKRVIEEELNPVNGGMT